MADQAGNGAPTNPVANTDAFLAPPVFRSMRLPPRVFCEPNVVLDSVGVFSDVRIGLASYMNGGMIRSRASIGRYCSIGRNVVVGASQHPTDWLTTHPFVFDQRFRPPGLRFPNKPTTIGNDVWCGDNVLIIEGVTVGDGAILGASAVVTKDVPAYTIVGGVPAKPIRGRFSEEVRAALLALQWWRYHPDQLRGLPFDRIAECIEEIRRRADTFEVLADCHAEVRV